MEATLSDVADVAIGRQRSPKHATGEHMTRYLRSANVKDGRLDLRDVLEMNFNPREQGIFALEPGDVLISEGSASETQVGASAVWHGELPGVVCFQNTLLRFRAKPGVTDPAFLAAWTSHAHRSGKFAEIAGGSSILHIGSERASVMPVRWPSVIQQRKIADVIGALDAQIAALDCESDSVRVLLAALRESLVADVTWEPVATLARNKGIQIGPFGSQLHAHEYTDDGVPVVMPQDLIGGEISLAKIKYVHESTAAGLSRHRLQPGDLVLPRRGDLTKRALVKEQQAGWLCGTGCIRIRLEDPSMAEALLEGLSNDKTDEWLVTNAVGTTMLNLNTEIVSKMPAPRFTPSQRAQAEGCAMAQKLFRALRDERSAVATVRQAALGALLSNERAIPKSYDALIPLAV